jgi:hypothetical protein
MTYTFKLARRLAVSRHWAMLSLLVLLAACSGDSTAPDARPAPTPSDFAPLQVFPRSVTIEASQRVQFRGQVQDSTGAMIATQVAWEATGGTIDSTGTFSSSHPGTYQIIARRRWVAPLDVSQRRHGSLNDIEAWRAGRHQPGATDTSVVQVVPISPKLKRLAISPKPITIDAGSKHSFNVTGYVSKDSTVQVGVTWSATGGAIDPSGGYTAGTTTGSFWVVATNTTGTLSDSAAVTIALSSARGPKVPASQKLASVVLTPAQKTLDSGTNVQYQVYGRTKGGDSVAVAVGFSATGGTITSSGLFTAGSKAGTFKVIARDSVSSLADTAQLTVTVPTTTTTSPLPTTTTPVAPSIGTGIPYGAFALAGQTSILSSSGVIFTLSMDAYSASSIIDRINQARASRAHLMIAMASGRHSNYTTDGVFDMAKWQAKMNTYNTSAIKSAVAAAVADGTILGNEVMDEPHNTYGSNSWGPAGTMTKARIDEMCGYVKNMFPSLPAGVTHDQYVFEPTKSYRVCDFMIAQYAWRKTKGDIVKFRDDALAIGRRDGIAIAFSLNVLDGGMQGGEATGCPVPLTGGPGLMYDATGACKMTASQVRNWGEVLGPAGCALLMWRYDPIFFSKTDNAQAFKDVASAVAKAPARACRRA